jgi:hypothetical protein
MNTCERYGTHNHGKNDDKENAPDAQVFYLVATLEALIKLRLATDLGLHSIAITIGLQVGAPARTLFAGVFPHTLTVGSHLPKSSLAAQTFPVSILLRKELPHSSLPSVPVFFFADRPTHNTSNLGTSCNTSTPAYTSGGHILGDWLLRLLYQRRQPCNATARGRAVWKRGRKSVTAQNEEAQRGCRKRPGQGERPAATAAAAAFVSKEIYLGNKIFNRK